MSEPQGPTVVIGCGNLLGGDDGVGLIALERLRAWDLPPEVELADGGTWGLNLLPLIERAGRLLLLDAVSAGERPGTIVALQREVIPRFMATRLSPHQIDLREVLALAEFRGTLPEDSYVLGIQPGRIDLSTTLSPEVEARVDKLVEMAVELLRRWGHTVGSPAEATLA